MYMDKERFYVILGALLMIISLPALIAAGFYFRNYLLWACLIKNLFVNLQGEVTKRV